MDSIEVASLFKIYLVVQLVKLIVRLKRITQLTKYISLKATRVDMAAR